MAPLPRALECSKDLAPLQEPKSIWFDTGTITESALLAIRSSYGIDRLVLGTDATYGDAAETVDLIRTTKTLASGEAHWILDAATASMLGGLWLSARFAFPHRW
ncbi:hypothetical protein [Microbacterium murale]|nr:hypothetical protein [Microbacterium murale]